MRKDANKKKIINKSGIILTNEIRITPYSCESMPMKICIIQHLFIMLAVASSLYCFIDRIGVDVSAFILNISIFFATIIVYHLCFIVRKYRNAWPLVGAILLMVIMIIYRINHLRDGFLLTVDTYLKYYNMYFQTDKTISATDITYYDSCTELFIFIAIFLIIVITYTITCYMSRGMYMMVTLPWICICFVVGFVPSEYPFYIYILSTMALWSSAVIRSNYCIKDAIIAGQNNVKQKNFKDIAAVKIGLSIFTIVGIMCLITLIVFPKRNFNDEHYISDLRVVVQERIDKSASRISKMLTGKPLNGMTGLGNQNSVLDRIGYNSHNAGGIANGKLGRSDGIEYENVEKLDVLVSSSDQVLYLKGYVGMKYNNGWSSFMSSEYDINKYSMENLSYTNASLLSDIFNYAIIDIKNTGESGINKNLIVPYSAGIKTEINENGYVISDESGATGFYIYNFDDIMNKANLLDKNGFFTDNYINKEQSKGAIDNFTKVPEDISEVIDETKNDIDFLYDINDNISTNYDIGSKEKFEETIHTVDSVREYIKSNYLYDLTPGRVPDGVDPVKYFLTESKKGYCMYFAAATTALLRAYGIPTRYVEGYIVTKVDYENSTLISNAATRYKDISTYHEPKELHMYQMSIKDTNSHAWVEIYIDGLGWVPVECTGNSIEGSSVPDIIESYYVDATQPPDVTISPDNDTQHTTDTSQPAVQTNKPEETSKKDKQPTVLIAVIFLFGTVMILFAAIYSLLLVRKSNAINKYASIKESKTDMVKYMTKILNKMLKEYNIVYKNNMSYMEYAKLITNKYSFMKRKDVAGCLSIIIKDCYSKEGISDEEYEVIKEMYNYFVENVTKECSSYMMWKYTNIDCIRLKID